MDYAEFRRHLGKAGLTVGGFAAYMGVTANAVSNHARRGEVPRSYALLAVLMGDAADRGVDFASLLRRFGVSPNVQSTNVHALPPHARDKHRRSRGL